VTASRWHSLQQRVTALTLGLLTICGLAAAGLAQEPPVTEPPVTEPPATEPPVAKPPAAKPSTSKPTATKPEAGAAAKPEAKPEAAAAAAANEQDPTPAPPPLPKRQVTKLTTPDGSRFVIVEDPEMQHVHWVIASWADGSDDPPGLTGLALATVHASLNGTWTTGSLDIEKEQQALNELDAAWQQKMAAPGNAQLEANVVHLDMAASKLGDTRKYLRVLAAAPTFRPEVIYRDPIVLTSLTTIAPALPTVAKLLFERREDQALRGMARTWLPSVMRRMQTHVAQPRRRLHAELLALVNPFSAALQRLEQPPILAPTRAQANSAWQSSQHPTRTVNVLIGGLDAKHTKAVLDAVFATTALPAPTPRRTPAIRPMASQRRSIVPGIPKGGVAIGWLLPPNTSDGMLTVIARWLSRNDTSLARQLRKGRPGLAIKCHAPWPRTSKEQGLLVLDIVDPSGKPGLTAEVLKAVRQLANAPVKNARHYRAFISLTRDWNAQANDSHDVALAIAERALKDPKSNLSHARPMWYKPADVMATIKAVFSSQPAVVEGRK